MKLAISCTTYNRPSAMLNQLRKLYRQIEASEHEADVLVVNDGSLRRYQKVKTFLDDNDHIANAQYDRFVTNMGKQRHWQVVNYIFRWYKERYFKRAIYLQDDLIIPEDFLEKCIRQFEIIDHAAKVCLNIILEESRNGVACWTGVPAREVTYQDVDFYRVGWVELHFIANRDFFRMLDWKINRISKMRWKDNPGLSSGVGRQISKRLFNRSKAMFQVRSSLAMHGRYPSVMSPEKRSDNRLKSVH